MRSGGLSTAREIDEMLQTFIEARDFVGKRLKINNIDIVLEPDWVYVFFHWERPNE